MTGNAKGRERGRALWLRVHLWLALGIGAVVAILGASGAALVLKAPIVRHDFGSAAFDLPSAQGTAMAPIDRWAASAEAVFPGGRIVTIAAPGASPLPTDAGLITLALPDGRYGFVTVNPSNGRAMGSFYYGEGALFTLLDLHRSLLLPGIGMVVGVIAVVLGGIALIVSTITGLWLWWPRDRRFLYSLRIRRGPDLARSLHTLIAVPMALPFLAIAGSGLALVAAELGEEGEAPAPTAHYDRRGCSSQPGYDRALDIALGHAGGRAFSAISPLPDGNFSIRVKGPGGESEAIVDSRCGKLAGPVTAVSPVESVARAIHNSLMLGAAGRIWVAVAGLSLPMLYLTGLWRWLARRRSLRSREV